MPSIAPPPAVRRAITPATAPATTPVSSDHAPAGRHSPAPADDDLATVLERGRLAACRQVRRTAAASGGVTAAAVGWLGARAVGAGVPRGNWLALGAAWGAVGCGVLLLALAIDRRGRVREHAEHAAAETFGWQMALTALAVAALWLG